MRIPSVLAPALLVLLACSAAGRRVDGAAIPGEPPFGPPRLVVIDDLPLGAYGTPLSTEEPFVSRDGRFLFFNSGREEGEKDLHFAERTPEGWRYRGALGPGVNDPASVQGNPSMDRHGNFFYVDSRVETMVRRGVFRPDGSLVDPREIASLPKRRARPRRGRIEGTMGVEVSADGSWLLFSRATWTLHQGRLGPLLDSDLRLAVLRRGTFVFAKKASRRLLQRINTQAPEYAACLSADGQELFFTRMDPTSLKSGRIRSSLLHAVRLDPSEPFGRPHVLASVGSSHFVEAPTLSPDGRVLYYHQRVGRKFRLFRVRRDRPFSR